MPEKKNILTRDIVLEPSKLDNSGLNSKQAEFLFNTLEETFGEVQMPDSKELADISKIHPIVWMLIDYSGKDLQKLFQLCLEISIVKNIPGYKKALDKIANVNEFNGVRAEIFIGSRLRSATQNVQFIEEKNYPQPDFEIKIDNRSLYVEVKGNDKSDFEVGLDMFERWIRNKLKDIFPKDNSKRIVRFGEVWMGGIAAACNIKVEIENASWAFHSSIMSLADQAYQSIKNTFPKHSDEVEKIEHDIKIITIKKTEDDEQPIVIELPQAKRIATIGSIIRKLTDKRNIKKFNNGNGVFAFYTSYAVNKIISDRLLSTLLVQCPELKYSLLGLAIFNSEGIEPIYIYSWDADPKEICFPNYFKEPIWDENISGAIFPS